MGPLWGGRREVCLNAMKPADVLFKGALVSFSHSVFGFQFLSLSGCLSSMHSSSQFFPLLFCGGVAPRRGKATGRVDRSTWGETTTVTSHFTACCSQLYTPGTWCTVSSCVSVTLNKVEPGEKRSVSSTAKTMKVSFSCIALRVKHLCKKVKVHNVD